MTHAVTAILLEPAGGCERLGEALHAALAHSPAELVLPLTEDAALGEDAWTALAAAAAAEPDAGAFALTCRGLAADPAWRGRRCRSHLRNVETTRFATLWPPGAVAFRRSALTAALSEPLPAGEAAWRELIRRVCRDGRVVPLPVEVRRSRRAPGEAPAPAFAPPAPADVLVLGQIEVSTSLYFDFLGCAPDLSVAFRAASRLAVDAPHLAAARLVVLSRTLHRFWDEGVIAFLEAAGTPWVWFTDDNFQALAADEGAPGFFTERRMRRALAGAAEVWASTPPLAQALTPLHPAVKVWGPVLDPVLADAPYGSPTDRLTIAVPGGAFRIAGLAGDVIADLRRLAAARPLRVVASEAAAAVLAPALPAAEVVAMPMERSFRQFVRQWRRHGPDLVLHPAGATANAAYKCPTAAIVAGYLGATPVVADEPAYAGWGEAEGIVRLDGLAAAAAAAQGSAWRAEMGARLAAALAARFGDAGRADRLRALGRTPHGAPAAALRRLAGRRAGLALAHATRRVRDLVRPPG